jgi:hypothetical protein
MSKPRRTPVVHARLHYCDINDCQGICCSDGAFLLTEEEDVIHAAVRSDPAHFVHLPETYIIDGEWEGHFGRKTTVREFVYRTRPAHFADTRCVMAEADGKCSLQTLAVKRGEHKWKYKPMGCWLFPLASDHKGIVRPPRTRREDPNNLGKTYPGFSTFTPCGKHAANGRIWWLALREEVAHYRSVCTEAPQAEHEIAPHHGTVPAKLA